jgi:hypothetical protein
MARVPAATAVTELSAPAPEAALPKTYDPIGTESRWQQVWERPHRRLVSTPLRLRDLRRGAGSRAMALGRASLKPVLPGEPATQQDHRRGPLSTHVRILTIVFSKGSPF